MSKVHAGDLISVQVIGIESYGIRVQIDSQVGIVQLPELSWDLYGLQSRISTVCKEGDFLAVKVLSVTDDAFYASVKQAEPEKDPWNEANKPAVGQETNAEVVLVADYGCLIKLPNCIVAVMPSEAFEFEYKEGDVIRVRILAVDEVNQKVTVCPI